MNEREESITNARAYVEYILKVRGISLPHVPDFCIIAHSDVFIAQVRQTFPCRTLDIGSRRPAEVHFFSPPRGRAFAVVAAHHGAPMAALLLEELIALGFQRFISLGPAGAPANGHTPPVEVGEVVLVEDALIYEGTSSHYGQCASCVSADPAMVDRLAGALGRHAFPHRRGRIATTDAIYRETPRFLDEIIGHGAVAMDMEVSALFSVSRFHGKPIGALLFISDVVGVQAGWDVAFVDDRVNRAEASVLPVLLECVNAP